MVNKKLIGGLILAFVISTVVASALYFCILSWRQSKKKRKKEFENSTIHLTKKSSSGLSVEKQAEPNQQTITHENDADSQDFVDSQRSQQTTESDEREQQKHRNQIQHSVRFTISSDQTNSEISKV